MAASLSKVKFDRVRYANCWEDAELLIKGLQAGPGSRILSVCSAGDNSFSLLSCNPEQVLAVDVSRPQLFLTELKAAAIKALEYEELLAFLGVSESASRLRTFNQLRPLLSADCIGFYERNEKAVYEGIIHSGKFENYFRLFRRFILPLIHSRKVIKSLLSPKSMQEQKEFYDSTWNTIRWRLLFRIFFSKTLMGKLGRDPEFLKQVDVPVAEYLFNRSEMYIGSVDLQKNPYLHYIFTGNYGLNLPHYLIRGNLVKIRENLDRLEFKQSYIQELKQEGFTHFNLSNIFEYLDKDTFRNCSQMLAKLGTKGAKYFYWNLMVPRSMSEHSPDIFNADETWKHDPKQDRCFFYRTANRDIRI